MEKKEKKLTRKQALKRIALASLGVVGGIAALKVTTACPVTPTYVRVLSKK